MRRLGFALCLLVSLATAVQAQGSWRDAVASDVAGTDSESAIRAQAQNEMLSTVGDFDANGRPDVVRLRINESSRRFAVVVRDQSGDHVVKTYPLTELHDFGLYGVERRAVRTLCWGHRACERSYDRAPGADGFVISQFSGNDLYYYRCPEVRERYCLFGWYD